MAAKRCRLRISTPAEVQLGDLPLARITHHLHLAATAHTRATLPFSHTLTTHGSTQDLRGLALALVRPAAASFRNAFKSRIHNEPSTEDQGSKLALLVERILSCEMLN